MHKKFLSKLSGKRQIIIPGVAFLFIGMLVWAIAGHKAACKIEISQLLKTRFSWDGALLPAYPKGQQEITILRIIIPPGEALVKHEHPVINAGLLLKGELTIRTDSGKILYLKAGDAIAEVVNTWHYGKNEGRRPAEIVVFYAGIEGVPITVYKPK